MIRNETVPEPSPMVTSDETVVIENTPEKSTVVLPKVVPPYFAVIVAVPIEVPAVRVDVTLPP